MRRPGSLSVHEVASADRSRGSNGMRPSVSGVTPPNPSPGGLVIGCVLLSLVAVPLLMSTGCGSEQPDRIEGTSLSATYQGLGCECGNIMLNLGRDGAFELWCMPASEDPWGVPSGTEQQEAVPSMRGTWTSRGGDLTLEAGGWTVVFTECEVAVDAHDETALLPGLCWVESSGPTFADSSRLVASRELEQFLHPMEGDGSGTGL